MNDKYSFDAISFGKRLSELRKFYGSTQEDVADYIGVSDRCIRNWESGSDVPNIDNVVLLAKYFDMSIGEILEDEAYRIFLKKASARKRSIEIIEVEGKIEFFMEFAEDRYYDRYEVWVWDEHSSYKYMYNSVKKVISYNLFRDSMLDEAESIADEYRKWLFSILSDSDEDRSIKEQLEEKISCEKAGMADKGAVYAAGKVHYFETE
jgi:transcriptional regulator with XRE-family HTH domain